MQPASKNALDPYSVPQPGAAGMTNPPASSVGTVPSSGNVVNGGVVSPQTSAQHSAADKQLGSKNTQSGDEMKPASSSQPPFEPAGKEMKGSFMVEGTKDCCSHKNNVATPFGLNRYLLLAIMLVYVVAVGTHFFNWVAWEDIFRLNGIYSEKCNVLEGGEASGNCMTQDAQYDKMFVVFQLCMFSFSFIGGMLLDVIGPKLCCAFGNLMLVLGWLCLAIASPSRQLYYVGMAFVGAGSDPAFFGTLSISNLFPESSSLVIALLGAARSVSNMWPMLFYQLGSASPSVFSMAGISVIFIIMYGGCFVLVLLLVPGSSYTVMTRDPTVARELTLVNKLELASIGAAPAQAEVDAIDGDVVRATDAEQGEQPHQTAADAKHSVPQRLVSSHQLKRMMENSEKESRTLPEQSPLKKQTFCEKTRAAGALVWTELKVLGAHILLPLYFPVVLLSISNLMRNGYYLLSAKRRLDEAKLTLQIVNILAFLPGPVCGYAVNRWGPFTVMNALNVFMGLVFVCVMIAGSVSGAVVSAVFKHASAVLALPFIGFLLSQVYCYIALVFDPADLGKLAGFASFVAGLCGFATTWMTELAEASVGYFWMDFINLVITFISFGLTFFLMWRLSVKRREAAQKISSFAEPTA